MSTNQIFPWQSYLNSLTPELIDPRLHELAKLCCTMAEHASIPIERIEYDGCILVIVLPKINVWIERFTESGDWKRWIEERRGSEGEKV